MTAIEILDVPPRNPAGPGPSRVVVIGAGPAMLAVENIFGADHDIWNVNVEAEYNEQRSNGDSSQGTGRDAPILPRQRSATRT
jgi:hypothetical protein